MSEQISAGLAKAPSPAVSEFDIFWQKYPRRVGKPYAIKCWNAARKRASFDEIMDGLAGYSFSPNPKLRPHPSTWLNQDRWILEPELAADYGLSEWLETLPRTGGLSAHFYHVDELRDILIATGHPPSWRGSLDTLGDWMRDGYVPESVARVIAAAVGEFGIRPSLAAFDKRVRYRADRINGSF